SLEGSNVLKVAQPLLAIVSELTGYPVEMLDLEMDIEADLGIDSIKRVEILSTLEERIPGLPPVTPDMMGALKTLGQIAAFLSEGADKAASTISKTDRHNAGQATDAPRNTATETAANVVSPLLEIVSELTGYPVEMLDLEMDIEADLGIDSIKRVEILSTLEERMPGLPTVTPDMMGALKTLGQISAFLSTPAASTREHAPDPGVQALDDSSVSHFTMQSIGTEIESSVEFQTALRRSIVAAKQTPLDRLHSLRLPENSRIYVMDDDAGLSAEIVRTFRKKNISADLLSAHRLDSLLKGKDDFSDAAGLVILAPTSYQSDAGDDRILRRAFLLAKKAAAALTRAAKKGGAVFATISRLDGLFGLKGTSLERPVIGGFAGLLKTAALEWTGVACRALDVDPDWNDLPAVADAVTDELIYAGASPEMEIGLSPGRRNILQVQPSPPQAFENIRPDINPADVVLISGGARGVTAAAAIALSRKVSANFVLIGRSPEPFTEPSWLNGRSDPAEMKRAILENAFHNNGAQLGGLK
ncbi:MAG: phosphopantetheine-binding protein, partial [Deltaproteobacteria bacterium]